MRASKSTGFSREGCFQEISDIPQGLKPRILWRFCGTTKVVPFQNAKVVPFQNTKVVRFQNTKVVPFQSKEFATSGSSCD
jgi:hypothetical protein